MPKQYPLLLNKKLIILAQDFFLEFLLQEKNLTARTESSCGKDRKFLRQEKKCFVTI